MITENDLYDISRVLINIRNDIQNPLNYYVLVKIKTVLLSAEKMYEDNQFRKALACVSGLNAEKWYFVYHNNVYVNHNFVRDNRICQLFVKIFEDLCDILKSNNFERAYDLVDAVHCLPIIIAENRMCIPLKYWKCYMAPYRNRWDKAFLAAEQRELSCFRFLKNYIMR